MEQEIIGVIKPITQGTPKPSLYVLIPLQLRNRLGINENTEFVILLAANGDIIYRQKEA
jgi:hypothetical protein